MIALCSSGNAINEGRLDKLAAEVAGMRNHTHLVGLIRSEIDTRLTTVSAFLQLELITKRIQCQHFLIS